VNTVNLIGRLTADPDAEQYDRKDGKGMVTVARFRLAVARPAADADPDYVPVVAFNGLAATIMDYCRRGRRVAVTGRLAHSEWTTETGERRSRLEVNASQVDFLDRPGGSGGEE
jgi:single-strand DNA-binding protein